MNAKDDKKERGREELDRKDRVIRERGERQQKKEHWLHTLEGEWT